MIITLFSKINHDISSLKLPERVCLEIKWLMQREQR